MFKPNDNLVLRVTRNKPFVHGDIVSFLDSPPNGFVTKVGMPVNVSGWVVSKKGEIKTINVVIDKKPCAEGKPNKYRSRVARMYAGYHHSEAAGFETTVAYDRPGHVELFVVLSDNKAIKLHEFWLEEFFLSNKRKIVYVHIGKAAGTSVNNYVSSQFGADSVVTHLESCVDLHSCASLHEKAFLSGHISFDAFKKLIYIDDYYKIITFRHPVDHIISHIAWIRHLADLGCENKLAAHPKFVQELSKLFASTDLSNPLALARVLDNLDAESFALLDNTQTRYLRASNAFGPINAQDLNYAKDLLGEFDLIGTVENIKDFFAKLAANFAWSPPRQPLRDNVLQSKYGLSKAPSIVEALMPFINYDMKLYSHVVTLLE